MRVALASPAAYKVRSARNVIRLELEPEMPAAFAPAPATLRRRCRCRSTRSRRLTPRRRRREGCGDDRTQDTGGPGRAGDDRGDRTAEGARVAQPHVHDDHAGRQRPAESLVADRVRRSAAPPRAGLPERLAERVRAHERRRRLRQERAGRAQQQRAAPDPRDHGDLGERDVSRRAHRPRRPRPLGGVRRAQNERRGADRAARARRPPRPTTRTTRFRWRRLSPTAPRWRRRIR